MLLIIIMTLISSCGIKIKIRSGSPKNCGAPPPLPFEGMDII